MLLILTSMVLVGAAQPRVKVTGQVTEADGQGIPGVSILVKGTMVGTITDFDGNYTIDADPQSTLVFSFVGFTTVEIPIGNQTVINVQLREQAFDVEEVVVVGYGTQKVKDLTSSITTVKSDELAKTPRGRRCRLYRERWRVCRWSVPVPPATVRPSGCVVSDPIRARTTKPPYMWSTGCSLTTSIFSTPPTLLPSLY